MTELWIIEGTNFYLRQVLPTDLYDIYTIYSDPTVMRFASDPCFTSIDLAERTICSMRRNILNDSAIELGVATHSASRIVGTCSLQPAFGPVSEIGFLSNSSYWGSGIMLPAVRAFLAIYSAKLDLVRVDAEIDPENTRSVRFAEKLGFRRVGNKSWSCDASHFRTFTTDTIKVNKELIND
jgi:ribosomal-protein-alanine N-acetyltransferase